MQLEEYGQENEKVIVMLHGANFVHSFQKQYVLAANYHIIVPHLMGFGNDTDRIFDTEKCEEELVSCEILYSSKCFIIVVQLEGKKLTEERIGVILQIEQMKQFIGISWV